MKKNVGVKDQFFRFGIAFIAVLLYFADCISGIVALSLFAILALTALLNFCPLYGLFGFNTFKKENNCK